jgi:hypothetical protein
LPAAQWVPACAGMTRYGRVTFFIAFIWCGGKMPKTENGNGEKTHKRDTRMDKHYILGGDNSHSVPQFFI